MSSGHSQSSYEVGYSLYVRHLYGMLAPRAFSVIMFGALVCTLSVKLFHSWRYGLLNEYFGWVLADISFLLVVETILALVCFRWPKKWVLRITTIVAAIVCTWSVMNAGWLIRTGTQILPRVLLPLVRAPLHTLCIIGVNLMKMPITAFILLGPSVVALIFFFVVLADPLPPNYNRKRFLSKVVISLVIVITSILAHGAVSRGDSGLHYNCHL